MALVHYLPLICIICRIDITETHTYGHGWTYISTLQKRYKLSKDAKYHTHTQSECYRPKNAKSHTHTHMRAKRKWKVWLRKSSKSITELTHFHTTNSSKNLYKKFDYQDSLTALYTVHIICINDSIMSVHACIHM